MSSGPPLPSRSPSPSRLSDRSDSSSSSVMPPGPPPPSSRPRRESNHLTPEHRPRSPLSSRDPSRIYGPQAVQPGKWSGQDPRSSSMQSLLPTKSTGSKRRTLLLIYIHGFLGNETSFQSFPAHVHNILSVTLSESHAIHTKIYPPYRSRKPIEHARDDFSNWLTPHESPETDLVLLGHSLGGILAAEVALLQPSSARNADARIHRILGLLAFDTPFLGLHPGVISTGITSLFRSKPDLPARNQSPGEQTAPERGTGSPMGAVPPPRGSTLSQVPDDPNYNPTFTNDARISQRKGLHKALYFINKHSDGLAKASKDYVTSHLEFGGCLVDYSGLKRRYNALRAMEDVDELVGQRDSQMRLLWRARFVNYYSASTGRLKQPKPPEQPPVTEMKSMTLGGHSHAESGGSGSITPATPRLSLEEYRDDGNMVTKRLEAAPASDAGQNDPSSHVTFGSDGKTSPTETPSIRSHVDQGSNSVKPRRHEKPNEELDDLPPICPLGQPPADLGHSDYKNPDHLKSAQQDHAKLVKAYNRARKDHERSIREREKLTSKREKAAKKEADKAAKAAAANESIHESQKLKRAATLNPEVYDRHVAQDAEERKTGASTENEISQIKKQRDRKFCKLPMKDPRSGARDPTWIRVYMEGVDEVTAHTSLFIPEGATYERLVGDTAERIENWVKDDQGLRAALESRGDY